MGGVLPPDCFHMALFCFISGYFFKEDSLKKLFTKESFFLKKLNRLLLPYLFWSFFYCLLMNFIQNSLFDGKPYARELNFYNLFINQLQIGNSWDLMVPAWFLVMLFSASVVDFFIKYLLRFRISSRDIVITIIYFIFIYLMINFSRRHAFHDWEGFFCRCSFALFFYNMGYLYNKYLQKHDNINGYLYFSTCFLILFILHFIYGQNITGGVYSSRYNLPPIQTILVALCGIALWLRIARYISPILKENKLILFIGNHTFSIMVHHGLFLFIFKLLLLFAALYGFVPKFNIYEFRGVWTLYCPNGNWIRFFYALFGILGPCLILYLYEKLREQT